MINFFSTLHVVYGDWDVDASVVSILELEIASIIAFLC